MKLLYKVLIGVGVAVVAVAAAGVGTLPEFRSCPKFEVLNQYIQPIILMRISCLNLSF